ncbi:AraC family transcriptional regulator [Sphingobium sp.]|uniref:helix-turn-helix domain-containing protein n=1 Tax=Sphingobium sp. TaxID=1912891 RepID=UPI0026060B4E|nr:AraC family transcriptional regulator [Sphingobium sp.]
MMQGQLQRAQSPDPTAAADIDTAQILALLMQARRAIGQDMAQADRYLDRACMLLRDGDPAQPHPQPHSAPLVPPVPDAHQPSPTGGLAGWQVRQVTAYIDARLGRTLATQELALVTSLSPGHFCRAFKASMGETPHAYIIRQRIRRAQTLMLDTRHSLSQIASACGLTDQAHLTRLFKRMVGTTPLLWRRTWQDRESAA